MLFVAAAVSVQGCSHVVDRGPSLGSSALMTVAQRWCYAHVGPAEGRPAHQHGNMALCLKARQT